MASYTYIQVPDYLGDFQKRVDALSKKSNLHPLHILSVALAQGLSMLEASTGIEAYTAGLALAAQAFYEKAVKDMGEQGNE